jgi:hypothetical protein
MSDNSANQNPLQDQKWLKEFTESFKKNVQQVGQKTSAQGWVSEINCTQADIGEPNYPKKPVPK